jgi:hypothetical protein
MHHLPDRAETQPSALHVFGPLALAISMEAREDRFIQDRKIVSRHCLARRNDDILSTDNPKNAATDGTIMARSATALPANNGDCEAGDEVCMSRQNPKAACLILCAYGEHTILIYDDRKWRDDT